MKVFVCIFLPILISSKNYLIETKDSLEANGDEVKDFDAGTDYAKAKSYNLKKYIRRCTSKEIGTGNFCKRWERRWLVT